MKRVGILIVALGVLLIAQAAQADWIPAKKLTWTSGDSINPAVVIDFSGNLHVVWSDDTPGNGEIYYRKSTNGGTTWTPNRRLTWTSGNSFVPAISVDSLGNLHLIWHDETPGNLEVYYKRSTDGGVTWEGNKRITSTSNDSMYPAIATDVAGILHVIWFDLVHGFVNNSKIYYMRSTDSGLTWTPGKLLASTPGDSYSPDIAVDLSGNPHVVWQDENPGNGEIYYIRSTDAGVTWSGKKRLTWTSGNSGRPAIVVDTSDNLQMVWEDRTPGNWEIYYKKSADRGDTWTPSKRLTWDSGESWFSQIAVDSWDNLHLVWCDSINQIRYKKSADGGNTWAATKALSGYSGYAGGPDIAADASGNLHAFWRYSLVYDDNNEIFYRKYVK